jgi:HD-GYP domain-containing protein (c-di-GMP phosphodiesterase class II)
MMKGRNRRQIIQTDGDFPSAGHKLSIQAITGVEADLVEVLARIVEQRDPYTATHMSRVAWLSVHIGTRLGFDERRLAGLRLGAELHDLGKFAVPTEILTKPGRLSSQELELVKQHPKKGYEVVAPFAWSWRVPEMLLQHHERIDGSGYPHGIKGSEILDEAKIIAVADVADAMISHRPYRSAFPRQQAIDELKGWRGARYEPVVVDACVELLNDGSFALPSDAPDFAQMPDRS